MEQDDKELLAGLKEQFLQPPSYEVKYKYRNKQINKCKNTQIQNTEMYKYKSNTQTQTFGLCLLIPAQGYNRTMITVPLQSLPFKYSSYQYSQYGQVRRNINQTIPRIGSEQYPMSTKVFSYTGCFPGQIYLQTISKGKT